MTTLTEVKERPILFSTPMVKAILEGNKTVTRRIIKVQPDADSYFEMKLQDGVLEIDYNQGDKNPKIECPYGKPGDILWVREEHYRYGHWEKDNTKIRKSGRQAWKFVPDTTEIRYHNNAPTDFRKGRHHKDSETQAWHKRLARFMPRAACRLRLEIVSITVERLQDITEEDAIREGIYQEGHLFKDYIKADYWALNAKHSFETLWKSINGADSWNANPWVWRIEFKKL